MLSIGAVALLARVAEPPLARNTARHPLRELGEGGAFVLGHRLLRLILVTQFIFNVGAGPILWVVATTTLRQTVTPRELLGRVSAINSVAYGARPLGAALGALIGGLYGAPACLAVAAVGFALQAGVILLSPAVALKGQPEMSG